MPFYNLGLEGFLAPALYGLAVLAFVLSLFWRPIAGLYFLVPMIPLQTIRYRLNDYPLGSSLTTILLIGMVLGLIRQRRPVLPRTGWMVYLAVYAAYVTISLCIGSLYLGHSVFLEWSDPRFGTWRDYIVMMSLLPVVACAVTTRAEIKIILILMCLGTLALDRAFYTTVADRDYSSYSEDLRDDAGESGQAGLNGLAAFTAQAGILWIALAAFELRKSLKLGYYALAGYSALCLMYSLSRGGYAAYLLGCIFLGFAKQRKLLIGLAVLGFVWATVLPPAVQERVQMTYEDGQLDHSSETRLSLWDDAMQVFDGNAATGTGYETYAYMERFENYRDTHNIYIKVLLETGIPGVALFLGLWAMIFRMGWRLFRRAQDPLFASVGLGLAGWVVCSAVANFFGDRWSFLQVNGYMWVLGGLVAKAWTIENESADEDYEMAVETTEPEMVTLPDEQPWPA